MAKVLMGQVDAEVIDALRMVDLYMESIVSQAVTTNDVRDCIQRARFALDDLESRCNVLDLENEGSIIHD